MFKNIFILVFLAISKFSYSSNSKQVMLLMILLPLRIIFVICELCQDTLMSEMDQIHHDRSTNASSMQGYFRSYWIQGYWIAKSEASKDWQVAEKENKKNFLNWINSQQQACHNFGMKFDAEIITWTECLVYWNLQLN